MHTFFLALLLVAAIGAALFDARVLFIDWYSMTDPELTTAERIVMIAEITLCAFLISLTAVRLIARV